MSNKDYSVFIGSKKSKLTIVGITQNIRSGRIRPFFICKCDCGNIVERYVSLVISDKNENMACISCANGKSFKSKPKRTCKSERYHANALYNIIQRCCNEKNRAYKWYGERGITICDRWKNSLADFISDMGERPTPKHSIDRKNNDGNYEPGNCRWATAKEQSNNRRKFKRLSNKTIN